MIFDSTMNNKPSKKYINDVKPKIGDLAQAHEIGRRGRAIFIWEACPDCKDERWVRRIYSGQLCKSCALRKHSYGDNNSRWNGSRRTITKSGVRVIIDESHPYFCMSHKNANGYAILEHRLVMAEHLGRPLRQEEVVHHIDGDNLNNDIENLQLLPNQATHTSYTMLQSQINKLQERIIILEAELVKIGYQITRQGNPEPSFNIYDVIEGVETRRETSQVDEGIVHPIEKSVEAERSLRGSRFPDHEHQDGVPKQQCLGKLRPNSGKPKANIRYGNPELNGEMNP